MFHLNVQDDNDDVYAYRAYVTKPTLVITYAAFHKTV